MDTAVSINTLAVLACAVIAQVLGFAWYGPLFGKPWMRLSGMTPEKIAESKKKGMGKTYALSALGSLAMAYVLAHAMVFAEAYLKTSGVASGLMGGFWNWLGFVAPVTLGCALWEGKPLKLWALNGGYYLVTLSAMGVTLSLWK